MLTKFAKVFGFVLLAVGVLGFVPALRPDNNLLGLFHVNTIHNLIHIASGLVALFAGYSEERASRLYFQVFGVVYALVTVLGFISGDKNILGLVANNMFDNLLHILIAGTALTLGFGPFGKDKKVVT